MNDQGQVLAEWFLLSNVPQVPAERLALWYYWRWQIESFFKLCKQAWHQLESWQQETGHAIAKRLMVAAMACVVVWHLTHSSDQAAQEFQQFLVRLSGRQMKRNKPVTFPALLAGLWGFLAMLDTWELYSPQQLMAFAKLIRAG